MDGPIRFATRSGVLTVDQRPGGSLAMDFPACLSTQVEARSAVAEAIGVPVEWTGRTHNESFLLALVTGIPEDPVAGSAHTVLAPYWVDRLGRTSLVGLQVSPRSGLVGVELNGDRVAITGHAITVSDGILSSAANPR
jgi:predicted PhzF superfamily epimerase YddE/YHI9